MIIFATHVQFLKYSTSSLIWYIYIALIFPDHLGKGLHLNRDLLSQRLIDCNLIYRTSVKDVIRYVKKLIFVFSDKYVEALNNKYGYIFSNNLQLLKRTIILNFLFNCEQSMYRWSFGKLLLSIYNVAKYDHGQI